MYVYEKIPSLQKQIRFFVTYSCAVITVWAATMAYSYKLYTACTWTFGHGPFLSCSQIS